jgi:succinylglutamate desuccinylase
MTVRLTTFESVPEGFLDASSAGLHEVLPGPTLVHLPGRRPGPLFVSALLHGNEDVGLKALQALLKRHAGHLLPRALSFFIGNVEAARHGLRRLDDAPDYNRVWPGTPLDECAEASVMRTVVDEMRSRKVFASIDLHNNTGLNPHYGCVNRLDAPFLQLASLFSRTVVYFRTPPGVQSAAFAALCPAVTCECGKTGDETGVASALEFVDAVLRLESIPAHPVREGDVHLFHTLATVKVPETATMSFDESNADVRFVPDLDHFNFRELESGELLGRARDGVRLEALDEHGRDVSRTMFASSDGQIRLARSLMPAMLTRDERVVRQDCLCYLMERLPLPG